MEKLLQQAGPREPSPEEQTALAELRAEFPGWCFGLTPGRLIPWDAKRRRGVSWCGGVWAVEATTPEDLRELLDECVALDRQHAGARS
ncbi:hypothetical protein ACQPZ8_37490 [Actinomadura nitritigenes]|uniref:hypothetical protein n=1 Tax=Actinomadura nitritigenes TaxID=134602 RepID=UPI003D8BAE24